MELPPLELRRGDCRDLESFLAERIYEFNSRTTGYFDGESFGATQKDESGAVVAGLSGYTWGGCCFISHLWVAEGHRGSGLGKAMVELAERNAKDKNCQVILVSSHSFQAPGFYRRMGYEEQTSVTDHPVGHSNIFLAKRLASGAA